MGNQVFPRIGAIDAGNDSTKIAWREDGIIKVDAIENVAGPAIPNDMPPDKGEQRDLLHVELQNPPAGYDGEQFAGKYALDQLQDLGKQDRKRDKANSVPVNLIAPVALAMIWGDKEDLILGVGTTVRDFADQAPLLEEKLLGRHPVKFHLGPKRGGFIGPDILEVYPYGQAVATAFDETLADDGTVKHLDWFSKPILAINIGHGQIGYASLQNMGYQPTGSNAVDIGYYRVTEAIKDRLNGYPYYYDATIPQLRKATIEGFIVLDSETVDLRGVIEIEARSIVGGRLLSDMRDRIPSILRLTDTIVLGGAPAKDLADIVKDVFKKIVVVPKDPRFSDVRGILKRTEIIAKQRAK